MNLKVHLLVRMTLMGLLCWLCVSVYVVGQSGRHATRELGRMADQLQPIVAADVMHRLISVASDARYPDLGGAAARFPERICLHYAALDGSESSWGCDRASAAPEHAPRWIAWALRAIGPGHLSLQRPIDAYGLRVGTLRIDSDDSVLLQREWSSVRALLGLSAAMLLALDLLAFWVVGRALRPTTQIVAAFDRLGEGASDVRLAASKTREFALIAAGINRLAQRLADSHAARAELTARLIRLQEDERREWAHELHEEFGQCVSALSAVSAGIRQGVVAGETITETDVMRLDSAVARMMVSLRAMLQRLSGPPLKEQDLHAALEDLVTAWEIRLRGHPRIVLEADADIGRVVGVERALCAYRVVQECLSNIARHAAGSRTAGIRVWNDSSGLHVHVSNDLDGARDGLATAGSRMGLKLLSERASALHGTLSVHASATEFVVRADLPIGAK